MRIKDLTIRLMLHLGYVPEEIAREAQAKAANAQRETDQVRHKYLTEQKATTAYCMAKLEEFMKDYQAQAQELKETKAALQSLEETVPMLKAMKGYMQNAKAQKEKKHEDADEGTEGLSGCGKAEDGGSQEAGTAQEGDGRSPAACEAGKERET